MARGLRLGDPGVAWAALAALLAAGALLAWFVPTDSWDWQPRLAGSQPWRCWTAAFVHWSPLHLGANLAATAVVAAFGSIAGVPPRAALAWFIAWPLTHLGLQVQPALAHYGGLSGVLHAGVAISVLHLLRNESGRRRAIAMAVLAGLALKIVIEAPWGEPLRHADGWDIAVAPLAHASGALFGALLALLLPRQSRA